MGHGFFNGQILFSWAWVWDGKTQRVCTRCHLLNGFVQSRNQKVEELEEHGFGMASLTLYHAHPIGSRSNP
jgi:hypothetical protein